jgi:hypothetical protein
MRMSLLSWGESPQTPRTRFARAFTCALQASAARLVGVEGDMYDRRMGPCENPGEASPAGLGVSPRKEGPHEGLSEASPGSVKGFLPGKKAHTRARAKLTPGVWGFPLRREGPIRGPQWSEFG